MIIERIEPSTADIEYIDASGYVPPQINDDRSEYANVVVNKPWGYEYVLFQNDAVSAWVLFIQEGYQTSMHCHVDKKTSLIVLSGEIVCTTLNQSIARSAHNGLLLEKKVFHSSKTISPGGALIMEIETPANKRDLLRLDDKYGRKKKGYEGSRCCEKRSKDTHWSFVDNPDAKGEYTLGEARIQIVAAQKYDQLAAHIKEDVDLIACVTSGNLRDAEGNNILSHGDIVTARELLSINEPVVENVELLLIKKNNHS